MKWYSQEIDASQVTTAVSNSVAVFCGDFNQGPVNSYIQISTTQDLIDYYGYPDSDNYNDWFQAYNFLQYANTLYLCRAANINGSVSQVSGCTVTSTSGYSTENTGELIQEEVKATSDIGTAKLVGSDGNYLSVEVSEAGSRTVDATYATSSIGTAKVAGETGNTIEVKVTSGDIEETTAATYASSLVGTAKTAGADGNDIAVTIEQEGQVSIGGTKAISDCGEAADVGESFNNVTVEVKEDERTVTIEAVAASCEFGTAITAGEEGNKLSVILTKSGQRVVDQGKAASCDFAVANTPGEDGNSLTIEVSSGEPNITQEAVKASCEIATAVNEGTSGNNITIEVTGGNIVTQEAVTASCEIATAVTAGADGNNLSIEVTYGSANYTVVTKNNGSEVDSQTVTSASELTDNAYVSFITTASLSEQTYTLSGGTDEVTESGYTVVTKNGGSEVDSQTVTSASELTDNEYVEFISTASLEEKTYSLVGGVNEVSIPTYIVVTKSSGTAVDTQDGLEEIDDLDDNAYVTFTRTIELDEAESSYTLSGGVDPTYTDEYTVTINSTEAGDVYTQTIAYASEFGTNKYITFNTSATLAEGTYQLTGGTDAEYDITYAVLTKLSDVVVNSQGGLHQTSEVEDNAYVIFNFSSDDFEVTTYTFSGGTDPVTYDTYNVITTYQGSQVDLQSGLYTTDYLNDNDYVNFSISAFNEGTYEFTGGANAVYTQKYNVVTSYQGSEVDSQENILLTDLADNDYVAFNTGNITTGTLTFSGGEDSHSETTYNVYTYYDSVIVDRQLDIIASELVDNTYVDFNDLDELTVGTYQFSGGSDALYKDSTCITVSNASNLSVDDIIQFAEDIEGPTRYLIKNITDNSVQLDREIEDDDYQPTVGCSVYIYTAAFNGSVEASTADNTTETTFYVDEETQSTVNVPEDVGDKYDFFDTNRQIANDDEFDTDFDSISFSNPSKAKLKFISRNPGTWCNKLRICIATPDSFELNDSDYENHIYHYAFEGLCVDDYYEYAPTGNQVGILIYDAEEDEVLETYTVSFDEDEEDYSGNSMYIETVINRDSDYVYVKVNTAASEKDVADYTLVYDAVNNEYVGKTLRLYNATDSDIQKDDLIDAYDVFSNKEEIDIDIVIANELDEGSSAADLAMDREDCVAFIGARYTDVVGKKAATAVTNLVKWRNNTINYDSSFVVAIGNYKYCYDEAKLVA